MMAIYYTYMYMVICVMLMDLGLGLPEKNEQLNTIEKATPPEQGCQDLVLQINSLDVKYAAEIEKLKARNDHLETMYNELEKLKSRNYHLETMYNELKEMYNKLTAVEENDQNPDSFVSFTAGRIESAEINKGEIIVFERIIANYGNHYNVETGIFTCPFDAFYLFAVSLLPTSANRLAADLILGGSVIGRMYAHNDLYTSSASNLVVYYCASGQQVWVEGYYDGDYISGFDLASTFSGTLLRIV